jgi:RNA polymerase sigma-70 factor (ECF subfamily)
MDPEEGSGFEPPAQEPTPFDRTVAGEEAAQMTQLLDQIPAVYREVLTLRFREDLALDEIASIIRAPLPTAKSRLYRGLESLRKLIEGGTA